MGGVTHTHTPTNVQTNKHTYGVPPPPPPPASNTASAHKHSAISLSFLKKREKKGGGHDEGQSAKPTAGKFLSSSFKGPPLGKLPTLSWGAEKAKEAAPDVFVT